MTRALLALLAASLAVGCAHLQRTDQLDAAHAAYEKAQHGPAAEASPADLATAKKFLDLAEKGLETGDPKVVDDRATVALLKIQAAEALGRTHAFGTERDRTLQAVNATKQQLLDEAQQKLAQTQAELEKEKASRDVLETRLAQGRAVLSRETLIRDLPEGTVITLPGGQLFARGRSDLLPGGRDRLSRVADFLRSTSRSARVAAQPPSRDARTTALALSGKRAVRVRDFLVDAGVTPERISAEASGGKAAVHPLPASPEFAAGAVDIVLEPARTGTGGGGSSSPKGP